MDREADFLKAIQANPNDEDLYQIFADWLEDQGDPRSAWVRSRYVRVWMGSGLENPMPAILDALSKNTKVQAVRYAVEVIGAPIVPEMVKLLKHESENVRVQVTKCFRAMKSQAVDAIPALMEALASEYDYVKTAVLKAIKDIGIPPCTDLAPIQKALSSDNYRIRDAASKLLAKAQAKETVTDDLSGQLKSKSAAERLAAVQSLGHLKTKKAIEPLCEALTDKDASIRAAATEQLTNVVGPTSALAVEPLRKALKDKVVRVRTGAAMALSNMGTTAESAVPELIANLKSKDENLQQCCRGALARVAVGCEDVLNTLLDEIRQFDFDRISSAIEGLGEWPVLPAECAPELLKHYKPITQRQWNDNELGILVKAIGRLEMLAPAPMKILRKVVRSNQWHPARLAAEALGRQGEDALEAIDDLVYGCRNGAGDAATKAIAELGPKGITRLAGLLKSKDSHLRDLAAEGLTHAGPRALPALPKLRACLAQSDYPVGEIIKAIDAIGPEAVDAVPDLIPHFVRKTCSHLLTKTLSRFGPVLVSHLPALLKILENKPEQVSALYLSGLFIAVAPHTLKVLKPLQQMMEMTDPATKGDDWFRHLHRPIRVNVAKALGKMTDPDKPLPDLITLLNDPQPEVRSTAAGAMGNLSSSKAVDPLRKALTDPDDTVRTNAVHSLGQLGDDALKAVPGLLALVEDNNVKARREAITTLVNLQAKEKAVLEAMEKAILDPDKKVQALARSAIKKLS